MTTKSSLLFAYRLIFPRTGLKSNARKSLIGACLCIGISLVPLVMLLTVSNGMIEGITSRLIGLSSAHISCSLDNENKNIQSEEALFSICNDILKNVKGVEQVYPEVRGVALAASAKGRTGASIRAVSETIFTENSEFKDLFNIVQGETGVLSQNEAVIGEKLAEMLNLKAGQSFRLITSKTLPSGKIIPKITNFKVKGVISSGYQELDALWVFISLKDGFKILPVKSNEVLINIYTKDAFAPDLGRLKRNVYGILPPYSNVFTWDELNAAEFENFSSTQIMLLFIMLLIVLVASVNISSALVMLVMERRKEIAIIKSIGGSSQGITFAFLITGLSAGVMGMLCGIPVGLLCAVNFNKIIIFLEKFVNVCAKFFYILLEGNANSYTNIHILDPAFYLQNIPLSIPLDKLIVIGVCTLILSLLVSAIPAIKAGNEKPIDTLRKI